MDASTEAFDVHIPDLASYETKVRALAQVIYFLGPQERKCAIHIY